MAFGIHIKTSLLSKDKFGHGVRIYQPHILHQSFQENFPNSWTFNPKKKQKSANNPSSTKPKSPKFMASNYPPPSKIGFNTRPHFQGGSNGFHQGQLTLGETSEKKTKPGLLVDLFVQMLCVALELRTANLKSFFLAGCFSQPAISHEEETWNQGRSGP